MFIFYCLIYSHDYNDNHNAGYDYYDGYDDDHVDVDDNHDDDGHDDDDDVNVMMAEILM
jgi:hypothetical protein